jgi:formylglycine-generating enzyme required for sulfatase activity
MRLRKGGGDYGDGSNRGIRGGSYNNNDNNLRSSNRNNNNPNNENNNIGFRVASKPL